MRLELGPEVLWNLKWPFGRHRRAVLRRTILVSWVARLEWSAPGRQERVVPVYSCTVRTGPEANKMWRRTPPERNERKNQDYKKR